MYNLDEYIKTKEVVTRTGLGPAFWAVKRHKGDGPPFIRISHSCVRYKWKDVLSWLEKHETNLSKERNKK